MSAPGPGQVLFSFVRHWSRRPPGTDPRSTEQGRLVLVAEAQAWQERVFDQLSQGWSQQRRGDFQQAMTDLVDHTHLLDP